MTRCLPQDAVQAARARLAAEEANANMAELAPLLRNRKRSRLAMRVQRGKVPKSEYVAWLKMNRKPRLAQIKKKKSAAAEDEDERYEPAAEL